MKLPRSTIGRASAIAAISVVLTTACGAGDDDTASATDTGEEPAETAATVTSTATEDTASEDTATEDTAGEDTAGEDTATEDTAGELFPDVVGAEARQDTDGTWTFSATLSSPYDSPDRYADAWRVVGPDGEVYGVRELLHDHANEQPFTRSQSGIEIPDGVDVVTVEGRDQISGWGGATVTVELERL